MPADAILHKLRRAVRNRTGATLTASQVCELIDLGVLEILTAPINAAVKAEARAQLSSFEEVVLRSREGGGELTRESIAALTQTA